MSPSPRPAAEVLAAAGLDAATPPDAEGWAAFLGRVDEALGARDQRGERLAAELARTTDELGAREAKFATLTALSNDRYWEQDAELRFVRVKPAGREHDWVDANHVGRRRWELPGVDASDPIWNAHRATLERHEPFRDFVYARNADGAQRWTTVSGEPVFAADGAFRGYRGIARDLTPDKCAEQRVHELAHYDGLTGLLNRTIFRDELAASISHARRNDRRVAILFVDLDGFKQVNDMHGHAVGDRVLQETAKRLRSAVRATERIARLGGDEFVVLVEEDAPGAGLAAARRLVRALALPQEINNHEIHLSASIGVALYPDDSRDLDELLQQADLAMYRVKAAGGNAVGSFSRDLQIRARERVSIANDLRHALESGQFRVFWQPVVAATDGRVLAAEALLRWEHPLRGLVMPGTFIPIAEETGLIVPIGRWAMNVAFAQARAWAAAGHPIRVAVNLSPRQFRDNALAADVESAISLSGVDPRQIELELTETLVMNDEPRVASLLSELKTLGVRLALDDFGTGYSSLAWLRRFPIDTIKIDREFVVDLPADTEDVEITRSVIALAHSLGRIVVAEGVEREAQAELLRAMGCDALQGYLVSRPVPAVELDAVLAERSPAATSRRASARVVELAERRTG